MISLLWATSISVRRFLRRYMPTNILLDRIRTRHGLRWGALAMLLAVPHLMIAYWAGAFVDNGGPGWLNILVLLGIWNAFKMLGAGPVSMVMLIRVRAHERRQR